MVRVLKVDPKLSSLFPNASASADKELRRSIAKGGVLDPIKVWKGHDIIVDGHRRYAICVELGIDPPVLELEFADTAEVEAWMDSFQVSRRNLVGPQEALVIKRMIDRRRAQGDTFHEAAGAVSEEIGLTPRTIARKAAVATAVQKMEPTLREQVTSGQRAPDSDLIRAANMPKAEQKKIAQAVQVGMPLSKAIQSDKGGKSLFRDLQKSIGAAKRLADKLKASCEFGTYHKRIMDRLDAAGELATEWEAGVR